MKPLRALVPVLGFTLTGCAHLAAPKTAFYCHGQLQADGIDAMTTRTLDARGQLIQMDSRWIKPFALDPRLSIQATWVRKTLIEPVDGKVTFQLVPRQRSKSFRLELRSGSVSTAATDPRLIGELNRPEKGIVIPWSLAGAYAFSSRPLFLAVVDRGGRLLDSEPLDPAWFISGLALVKRTEAISANDAAHPESRCQRYQDILVV